MDTIKISIIIPVYNTQSFLHECLNSVVSQNFDAYEIICINDGSTDHSMAIIENYMVKNKNIKLLNQSNKGLSVARNNGLKVANGEYVLFVDSDDFLEENVLSDLYYAAKNNDLDLLDFKVYSFKNGIKTPWRNLYPEKLTVQAGKEYFINYVSQHQKQPFVSAWSHMYKREFIVDNELEFIKERYYEDMPFTFEAYMVATRVLFYDKFVVYNYRINEASITKGIPKRKHLEDSICISERMVELSNKYKVIVPMDNFFNPILKLLLRFSKEGRFLEIRDLLFPNLFKRVHFYLFNSKSKFFYNVLKSDFAFFFFDVFLRTVNQFKNQFFNNFNRIKR